MFQTVSYIAFNLSKAWDRPGNMGQVFQPECSLGWSQSIQIEKLNWPSILGNGQESRTITERSGARLYFQLRCLSWRVWATQGQGPLTPPVQCWCHGLSGNPTYKDRVQPLVAKENSRSQSGRARAQLTMKTEWNFKDKIQLMQVQKKISRARAHSALHGGVRDLWVAVPAVPIVILIPHVWSIYSSPRPWSASRMENTAKGNGMSCLWLYA